MSSKRRKGVNRPRSAGGQRAAKWVLLVAVLAAVLLVVLLARLTAERNSQPPQPGEPRESRVDTRSVEKPPEKTPVSPEFEFYTLLPEQGNQPPSQREEEPTADAEKPAEAEADRSRTSADGSYLIQVGSFRSGRDAEARKAELALMGFEGRVEKADVQGTAYHRVFVGPLPGDEVEEAQQRLQEVGVDALSPRRIDG
ncbi:MAG: SPOR domain-containing protein [Guyparkeria sp.]|uniref:SPOR domain-containing protein n=1 Tax=Guyparkeria sp. TaxID=2035736 RepID=UPI00397B4716